MINTYILIHKIPGWSTIFSKILPKKQIQELENLDDLISGLQNEYKKHSFFEDRKILKESLDPDWLQDRLAHRLEKKAQAYKEEVKKIEETINNFYSLNFDEYWINLYKDNHDYKKKVNFLKYYNQGPQEETITPEMIETAKNYPIENLIEVNSRLFSFCPFHDDKRNPNLYCKNNYYYCFSCGAHGSVIDLVMKRDKLTFKQAVLRLQY